jgi:hypothetical protein
MVRRNKAGSLCYLCYVCLLNCRRYPREPREIGRTRHRFDRWKHHLSRRSEGARSAATRLRDIRRPIEPADEGVKMSQDIRRMSKEDLDGLNELSAPIDKDDISLLPSRLRQIRERKPCLPPNAVALVTNRCRIQQKSVRTIRQVANAIADNLAAFGNFPRRSPLRAVSRLSRGRVDHRNCSTCRWRCCR